MSETQLTSRQQQALERRSQILETAVDLFAQNGFHGTSTRQIAEAAGITEGLIFHYFPTKDHLLQAILASEHSYFDDLETTLEAMEAEAAAAVVTRIAYDWLATLRRERAITLVLFSEAQTNAQVGAVLRELIQKGIDRLADYLETQVEKGNLRRDLPLTVSARMFFSTLMIFFITHHALPAAEWKAEVDIFVPQMIAVWLNGAA